MQNIRKIGALLGASVIMLGLAGCGGNGGSDNTGSDTSSSTNSGSDNSGSANSSSSNSGSDIANAASNNLSDTANSAAKGGEAVANGAANAGNAVANGAANVGQAMSNGAANIGKAVSGATMTPQIKTALGGNKALNGSNINVDTVGKTVTLSGTVKSAAQKTMAGMIAKQKATGFTITNNLKVGK